MKEICILGNGITAYILALLLGQKKLYVSEKDIIFNSYQPNLANVISMKLNVLSDEERKFLESKIDFSDCLTHKKAGYKYNGKIYDNANEEMIKNYLLKQNRDVTFDFKFETEFDAIDLTNLINKFKNNIELVKEEEIPRHNAIYLITNSQFERTTLETAEYVVNNKNDMHGYSYIYDCDLFSNVKRYSENNTECINKINNAKEVKNYYEKPKIFIEYDLKKDVKKYWIGRFASKTRIEQIDVLRFCMKFIEMEGML